LSPAHPLLANDAGCLGTPPRLVSLPLELCLRATGPLFRTLLTKE
jgi:hypothetical protein